MHEAGPSTSVPDDEPPPYSADHTGGRIPCAVEYINPEKGYGLLATEDLPAGTLIFKERMLVFKENLDSFHSVPEFNITLGQEVKAMGPEFARGFFTLPTVSKERLGIFGGILEGAKILALHEGKAVAMVGLNLAFVNHACVPNTQHTWIRPDMEGDGPDDKYHTVSLYACKYITAGEELTIAYHHIHLRYSLRREFTSKYFGFVCACDHCSHEDKDFEQYLALINEQQPYTFSSELIQDQPAGTLQVSFTIGTLMEKCGIFDSRLAKLFEQCAIISGWHSDEARAQEFLAKAQSVFVNLEGSQGPDILRIARFQRYLDTLPGFGWTKRGLSRRSEVHVLWLNPDQYFEILFMRNMDRHEFKRLRNYEGVRRKDSSYDEEDDVEEEAHTEHESQDGQETPQSEETVTGTERGNDINSLIEELSLEKNEFDKERHQNQTDPVKKGKGPKGRKAKKNKGKGNV